MLRTDYAELILPCAVPTLAYVAIREGRKSVREMDAKKQNKFSTQFLSKSTQLYATVRHAYAIAYSSVVLPGYCTPCLRNSTLLRTVA